MESRPTSPRLINFGSAATIYASEGDYGDSPYYVVLIDIRAAQVVAQFFGNPPHLPISSDPAIWTLDLDRAQAIVAASEWPSFAPSLRST